MKTSMIISYYNIIPERIPLAKLQMSKNVACLADQVTGELNLLVGNF